ncbi:hypothetical protein C8R44DRAFT_161531 [Mycena epipterygia]|nr:hypothetical protein C8R44DRAFT_161531 [Mycena epipterygia]
MIQRQHFCWAGSVHVVSSVVGTKLTLNRLSHIPKLRRGDSLSPQHHVFYTWEYAHTEQIHELTHLEFCRAVHRAADAVKHLDRIQPVGVLALCDAVLYHALFLGLLKAGYVVRPYETLPCFVANFK